MGSHYGLESVQKELAASLPQERARIPLAAVVLLLCYSDKHTAPLLLGHIRRSGYQPSVEGLLGVAGRNLQTLAVERELRFALLGPPLRSTLMRLHLLPTVHSSRVRTRRKCRRFPCD